MIRLAERNIFILNDQGEQEPFCLDDLRILLKTCLRESVIQDDFLIEDILYALDLFLNKAGSESQQTLRMTDIHTLLEKVLCDNGFADAATLLRLDSGRAEIDAEKRLLNIVAEFEAADHE